MAVGALTPGKIKGFAILGDAGRAFVVHAVDGFAKGLGLFPAAVLVAGKEQVFIGSAVHVLAAHPFGRKDDLLLVGRERRAVIFVFGIDFFAHIGVDALGRLEGL